MRCSPFFLSIAKADVPDLEGHGWGFPLIPQSEHHLLVSTGKLMWGIVYMRMDAAMNDKFVQEEINKEWIPTRQTKCVHLRKNFVGDTWDLLDVVMFVAA